MNNTEQLPSQSQFQRVVMMSNNEEEINSFFKHVESLGEVVAKEKCREGYVCLLKYAKEPNSEYFERLPDVD